MTDCQMAPDTAERYVNGSMPEAEQAAFEDHFFECEACLKQVQVLEDARQVLAQDFALAAATPPAPAERRRRVVPYSWLAVAAAIVLSVIVWRVPRGPDVQPVAAIPTPAQPPPPAPVPQESTSTIATPDVTIERMAAVIPPQYVPLTTRSAEDPDAAAFDAAMRDYSLGRYPAAAKSLGAIATRAPDLAHVQFFLGIAELMAGNADRAREALERAAGSGITPYSDEAHFYLAKAALGSRDIPRARRELQAAVDREAGPAGEAARLLAALKTIKP